jgi:hypothetical protein
MSSKENYSYKILNIYNLIVDFEGEHQPLKTLSPVDDETFAKWKRRVLGDAVTDVVLYVPITPAGNTRIRTLQSWASASNMKKTFRMMKKGLSEKSAIKIIAAKDELARELISFPKDTLTDLVDDFQESLEPSVKEFFNNFLENIDGDVQTETLIRELLVRYNAVVRRCRELES